MGLDCKEFSTLGSATAIVPGLETQRSEPDRLDLGELRTSSSNSQSKYFLLRHPERRAARFRGAPA